MKEIPSIACHLLGGAKLDVGNAFHLDNIVRTRRRLVGRCRLVNERSIVLLRPSCHYQQPRRS